MTTEEQNIKAKIENLSDLDIYFDDTDLWNRLEEKLDKKPPKKQGFFWLWSAAASLIIGVFLLAELNQKPKVESLVLEKSNRPINPIPHPAPKRREAVKNLPFRKEAKDGLTISQSVDNELVTEKKEQKQLDFKLTKLPFKANFDSLFFNEKTIVYQPKFSTERVTIVDFPVIPDALMARENFAKRVFRQIKNFNTEGKIDWHELNIEPRNVWAYLERSFRYDTTIISNKKHIKQ